MQQEEQEITEKDFYSLIGEIGVRIPIELAANECLKLAQPSDHERGKFRWRYAFKK